MLNMVLTLREQAVIKEWNKKGLSGLRVSSLALLENTGGVGGSGWNRDEKDESGGGVCRMLVGHTLRALPEGLWDKAEIYCREICFIAGVEFDMDIFLDGIRKEKVEREDEEFDD